VPIDFIASLLLLCLAFVVKEVLVTKPFLSIVVLCLHLEFLSAFDLCLLSVS
jgi:hypothetical protein